MFGQVLLVAIRSANPQRLATCVSDAPLATSDIGVKRYPATRGCSLPTTD